MQIPSLTLRPAVPTDAAFIARHVLEALHFEMFAQPLSPDNQAIGDELTPFCAQEGTLYSYRHTTMAEMGGVPVGMLIAYDGAPYVEMRQRTFAQISAFRDADFSVMDAETQAGEYYIDSVSVDPQWRAHGIGTALIRAALAQASELGLCPALVVDPDNTPAQQLYARLGMAPCGTIHAVGQTFIRMRANKSGELSVAS